MQGIYVSLPVATVTTCSNCIGGNGSKAALQFRVASDSGGGQTTTSGRSEEDLRDPGD